MLHAPNLRSMQSRAPHPPPPCFELSVGTPFVHASCPTLEVEGPLGPLTLCDTQCAGCLDLRAENATLQQAEQQASERIAMLEAENQHLRSLSQERDMPEPGCEGRCCMLQTADRCSCKRDQFPNRLCRLCCHPPSPQCELRRIYKLSCVVCKSRGTATSCIVGILHSLHSVETNCICGAH